MFRALLLLVWMAVYYLVYLRVRFRVKSKIYACRLKEELGEFMPQEVADKLSRRYCEELNAIIRDMSAIASLRSLVRFARKGWKSD